MKSDVISITNHGDGFEQALEETRKVSAYKGLGQKDSLHMTLFTEEMLSMARIVSGDMTAYFWIETEGDTFDLHMTTNTTLDKTKRAQLLDAATTRKNEAANSFLGKIRDAFEQAMASETSYDEVPYDVLPDIVGRDIADPEWDEFECSILRRLADNVKVSIRGNVVDMTVRKSFAA
ncbi:MAG: hypothetical protein IJI07_08925 [Flexilinea sp.]|nr:hypothetical protein [Flexilinea sp.]